MDRYVMEGYFMKKTFTVFGSCVSRDVFRFLDSERYEVSRTFGRSSIFTLFSEKMPLDMSVIDVQGIAAFEKRMLLEAFNKTILDDLSKVDSDWLFLDLGEERSNLLQTNGGKTLLTDTHVLNLLYKNIFVDGPYRDQNVQKMKIDQLDETVLKETISKFANLLKEKYPQDHMILLEVYLGKEYLNNQGEYRRFQIPVEEIDACNNRLKKLYQLLRQELPGAHFIKMPTDCVCVESHLWGIHPVHYSDSFYQYAAEAIENITKSKMTSTCEKLYSKQCLENRIFKNSIENLSRPSANSIVDQVLNHKDIQMGLGDIKHLKTELERVHGELRKVQTENALNKIRNNKPQGDISSSIVQLPKDKCTACGACVNACPIRAIKMTEDAHGFLHPEVDTEKCRNCGYCANICPQLNLWLPNSEKKVCLALKASDEERKKSASGGVFPVLAKYVLEKNGYVCGAAWNENWEVEHKIVDNLEDLEGLRSSKYVQSNVNLIYKNIKQLLEKDHYVLFSGTPCQVDGLYHYLGKSYDKLITMDILCHGVPAQKMFQEFLQAKYPDRTITEIQFRDKRNGWGAYTTIKFADGTSEEFCMQNCLWIMAYLKFYLNRASCYQCSYTSTRRVGDFTVGDFWGIEKYFPQFYDKQGVSVVTLNNDKAINIYQKIQDRFQLKSWLPLDYSIPRNSVWTKNTPVPEKRQVFLDYFENEPYLQALEDTLYNGKKFDIGIVGWWYYYNYGSILTYYALNRALTKMGYSVLMIHHSNDTCRMSKLENAFPENFIKKYCDISHFYSSGDMHLLNDRCRAFISGSDQLWNPLCENAAGPEFFLDFADDDKIKLSYASSLGNSQTADENFKKKYQPLVKRFQGVSVRENMGIEGCKEIYDVDAVKVCDPVFLCDPEEYEELARRSPLDLQGKKYLLSFILDPNPQKKAIIEQTANQMGLEYINLVDLTDGTEKAKRLGLENTKPFASVEDFLCYFKNASFIITDSFHGTCFSVIFNREFMSLANYGRGEKRVEELLKWLGIDGRILYDLDNETPNFASNRIDYGKVNREIQKSRKASQKWLLSHLKQLK